MNDLLPQEDAAKLIKENNALKRRVERMTKEMKNLTALQERALKLRDFSEREKNLQYEYNALLLENAPDMIFILDPEMRFRLGTRTFVRFLERENTGTLIDSSFKEFFSGIMPESWIDSTRALFESVMRERKQLQYNDEVSFGEARKVFTISVAPAIDSGGKIMGVICLMHDSTELVDMKEAAEAATRAKSSFLASMSHEIRTPMNAIKGFSDLLARTPLSRRQKAYTDNIVNATSSLLMIINDILDFSKIEANRFEIVKVDYDTASELSELCGLMQPKADEKGLYLAAEVDPGLPSALIGDNLRIRQILINVINNAIKFTHEGGITLRVSGEPAQPGEWARPGEWLLTYRVRDTGQGIREKELPQIFQAFEQVDFYKNRNIAGTGLGLAISKNLAELMGGNISAVSEYGAGSEFTVQIPQAAASESALARVENPEAKNVLLFHSNAKAVKSGVKPGDASMENSLEKLGVPHRSFSDRDGFCKAAREEAPTHILIDGDLKLAERAAEICPPARVGCLQQNSGEELGAPENIRIFFKPFLIFNLAAFLNDADQRPENSRVSADLLGSASYKGARVLIVDDNEINRIVASELVRTYDIEPDTANSGAEAVERVKNARYDLVFMDHMMPGMDGIEATKAIRSMKVPQPPVIALTANAILGMDEIYKQSGFDGYVTKPIDVDSLNGVLEKWLGSKA